MAESLPLPRVSTRRSQSPPQSAPEIPYQPPTPAPTQQARTIPKRARPTVSCFECRRKKLRCDRVQPCSQCVKARRENLCQFATGVTKGGVSRSNPQILAAAREDGGERAGKRMRIEDVMAPNSAPANPRADEMNGKESSSTGWTLGRIHIKGSRSRFLSLGDRMAMLDQFEDARNYIMNSFNDPGQVGIMYELSAYQNSFQRKPKKPQVALPNDRAALVSEMLKSMPTDGSLESALRSYTTHWEGQTRVLHMPALFQAHAIIEECLKSSGADGDISLPQQIHQSIIPQMIGVLVLSARFEKHATKPVSEEQVAIWIEMTQRWLDRLKEKEKLNIETLRVQTLLLLSKMNNLARTPDLWGESGALVRSAMIIGLHQDPESYESISLFEKEQRRKLWRTIVELDMQFSLAGGMLSAIRSSDFDSRFLKNVDDSALKEDTNSYPTERSERVWTDALPQIIMNSSLKERLDATNLLAGRMNASVITRLLSLARYFESSLQSLSNDLEVSLGLSTERSPGRLFMKLMLDVQLRRPTIAIYQSIMLSEHGSQYPEARKGALRNAISMLSHLDALDPEVADPNTIKNRDQLNLFHVLCKKDIMQAALVLCMEIESFCHSSRDGQKNVNDTQNSQTAFCQWTKASLTRIVENTLHSLLQRLGEFGSDLKDILPLSVVLFSARSDGTLEDKKLLMRRGIERVLKACREAFPNLSSMPATPQDKSQSPHMQLPNPFPSMPLSQSRETWNNLTATKNFPKRLQYNLDGTHTFGDLDLIPGDMSFQDFDLGFDDWDIAGFGPSINGDLLA